MFVRQSRDDDGAETIDDNSPPYVKFAVASPNRFGRSTGSLSYPRCSVDRPGVGYLAAVPDAAPSPRGPESAWSRSGSCWRSRTIRPRPYRRWPTRSSSRENSQISFSEKRNQRYGVSNWLPIYRTTSANAVFGVVRRRIRKRASPRTRGSLTVGGCEAPRMNASGISVGPRRSDPAPRVAARKALANSEAKFFVL